MEKIAQMFRLVPDIFDSINLDDIDATANDMWEMGIFYPPFEKFIITVKSSFIAKMMLDKQYVRKYGEKGSQDLNRYWSAKDMELFFYFSSDLQREGDNPLGAIVGVKIGRSKEINWFAEIGMSKQLRDVSRHVGGRLFEILIVLLATPNADKKVTENSLRGKFQRTRQDAQSSEYTTTIRIGKITETYSGGNLGTGMKKRPHLRRGHIRRQRVGEGRAEVKKIFIPPMFVNADENWIKNERKEYKVLMA